MNIAVAASIFLLYGTFIVLYFFLNRRKSNRVTKVTYINTLICYALCFLSLEFLPSVGRSGSNFAPFVNMFIIGKTGREFELANFLQYILYSGLSLLLFFPLGFFTGVYCRMNYVSRPLLKAFFIGLAVSVAVELLQLILPIKRFADIDDVIFNTVGAVLGALFFIRNQGRPFFYNFLKRLRLSGDVYQILS